MELLAKICLFGEAGVGKTSLIRRYVENMFDDKYISTFGTKVSKKKLKINDDKVTLMIWDIMGQKDYRALLQEAYFSGASGCMGVCDITRRNTLDELNSWVKSIYQVTGKVPLVLLANKCDLKSSKSFEEFDLKLVAARYDAPYVYTSAKTGENVEFAFRLLSENLIKYSATLIKRPRAKKIGVRVISKQQPQQLPPQPTKPQPQMQQGYVICAFCGTKNSAFERQCIRCASKLK
jgi:small GTP-binding protein